MTTPLEERIFENIRQKDPQVMVVENLINIKREVNSDDFTEIEIKTQLDEDEIKDHSTVNEIARWLSLSSGKEFRNENILNLVVERLERKNLSKDRKSRQEIIDAGRPQEQSSMMRSDRTFWQRMFQPKQVEVKP